MDTFQIICNTIVLVGAVTVAIVNIYNFFAKPSSKIKSRKAKELSQNIQKNLEEILPKLIFEPQSQTRIKYMEERKEIEKRILSTIESERDEILDKIDTLKDAQDRRIDTLTKASKDVLRQRIMAIYHKHKKTRSLPIYDKEALDELFKDYKAEHGNSYIDKYMNRMRLWEVYDDEEEDL